MILLREAESQAPNFLRVMCRARKLDVGSEMRKEVRTSYCYIDKGLTIVGKAKQLKVSRTKLPLALALLQAYKTFCTTSMTIITIFWKCLGTACSCTA